MFAVYWASRGATDHSIFNLSSKCYSFFRKSLSSGCVVLKLLKDQRGDLRQRALAATAALVPHTRRVEGLQSWPGSLNDDDDDNNKRNSPEVSLLQFRKVAR